MKIHILGICGTFMGGIAQIARSLGHKVTGSDANVYPPMSTQLEAVGIHVTEGYDPAPLDPAPDLVVIGNALSRGNPAVEYLLDRGLRYTSGPQWLADYVLSERWVLAVSGTHGKTTTAAMLAWILEYAGQDPGFLIGGVPENFGVSARAGGSPMFVVEADEYDTAFFDKRSKFVHYRPRTLVMNNLEFDHADIFEDLAAIQRQFHHLVRTVPGTGLIVAPRDDRALSDVLERGCWTPVEHFDSASTAAWHVSQCTPDCGRFTVVCETQVVGEVAWSLTGRHNVSNALAALAAARHAGVPPAAGIAALSEFCNVKRRMELRGEVRGVRVFDDFAHHPTAIATTLDGLRQQVGEQRILAVLELRSNSMRLGVHAEQLAEALAAADRVWVYTPADLAWDVGQVLQKLGSRLSLAPTTQAIVDQVAQIASPSDQILVMSNGGFEDIHQRLLVALGVA